MKLIWSLSIAASLWLVSVSPPALRIRIGQAKWARLSVTVCTQAAHRSFPAAFSADHDTGGEGVAFHDSDAKNNGSGNLNPANETILNEFRMKEGVDTSYTKFGTRSTTAPTTWSNRRRSSSTSDGHEWRVVQHGRQRTAALTSPSPLHLQQGGSISFDLNGKKLTDRLPMMQQSRRSPGLEAMASLEQGASCDRLFACRNQRPHAARGGSRKHEFRVPGFCAARIDRGSSADKLRAERERETNMLTLPSSS